VIKEYDTLLSKKYIPDEAQHMLSDHLSKLKESGKDLNEKLSGLDVTTDQQAAAE
jgi:hypothetical protein